MNSPCSTLLEQAPRPRSAGKRPQRPRRRDHVADCDSVRTCLSGAAMTYCLGIKLDAGLVFASDSRITSGIDYISTYGKLHTFQPADDRIFVILTSGNLGMTQELLDWVRRDLDRGPDQTGLRSVGYMFEVARYLGQTLFSI